MGQTNPPLEVGIVRVDSVSNMSPTFEKIRLPFKSAPPLKTITQRLQEPSSSLKRQKGFVLAASVRRTLRCSGRDGKFNMEALLWQAESSASRYYREPNLKQKGTIVYKRSPPRPEGTRRCDSRNLLQRICTYIICTSER